MTGTRFRRSAPGRRERGKRALVVLPLLCACTALATKPLRAQLTVDQLEVTITPSATARVMSGFVVRNAGKHPTQAIVTREDWDRAENGENRFVPSGSSGKSCAALMNVFPTAFRLEPGAVQTIRLAIEGTPAAPKECWDIFFVEEVSQRWTPTRSGLRYILRTGVKVYVVPAGLKRDASITDMSVQSAGSSLVSKTGTSASQPVRQRIAIQFSNSGEVHLAAKGRIEFRRLDNSIAMQIPIAEFPTLPGAVRRVELDVPLTVPPGTYIALALIDYGGAEIAAGQLELTVR
jgi:P pilus assembly chaperone PapD